MSDKTVYVYDCVAHYTDGSTSTKTFVLRKDTWFRNKLMMLRIYLWASIFAKPDDEGELV